MNLISGFTRKQTELLTGFSKEALEYLARQNFVAPQKFGHETRSALVYGLSQVIQLRLIFKVREQVSLQSIKKAIELIVVNHQGDRLTTKDRLVIINNQAKWMPSDLSDLHKLIEIQSGQVYIAKLIVLPSPFDVLAEITDIAKENQNIINFEALTAIAVSASITVS